MKRMLTPCLVLIAGALSIVHCGGDSESDSDGSKGSGGKGGGSGGASGSATGGASGSATGGASGSGTGGASGSGTGGASGSGTGGASGSGTGGSSGGTLIDASTNDPDCPPTEPVDGDSCADAGIGGGFGSACRYTNGAICFCANAGGGMRDWNCIRFDGGGFGGNSFGGSSSEGGLPCPGMRPMNGSTCFTAGRTCPYGGDTCTCQSRDGAPGNGWSCS